MQRISITNPQNIIDGTAKKYYFKLRNTGGPKGDKGDKGDTGSRGPQGEPGNAATVYVGSTTTLPVGQDATVENVGTQYNAVLNFGIPQGPQGPQGAKGDKGDTGAKGDTGPRGPQGERGTNATVYIGTTSTLNPGSQATVYNSGTENNAVLNFGIPRGEKGETGATGATGATGPAGQNFTPTIVDSLPATGNQSNLYLTPKNYTTGTATGNPITISLGEEAGQVTSAQLDGNTTQQTYSGAQIIKEQGFATPASNTVFWTVSNATQSDISNDGFSTFTFSGTSFKNFFIKLAGSDIKASTTYTVIIELDKVTDLPFITLTQGNANSDSFPDFTVISLPDGAYATPSGNATHGSVTMTPGNGGNIVLLGTTTSTLKTQTLRFFTSGSSTDGKKIRARVSVIEGDHTSDWQNYCGDNWQPYVGGTASPNPDYPQQIQTVTGVQTISINGTDYPIDLGTIKLQKIGNYQDYIYKSGDDWKVHKATTKMVLDGSETDWTIYNGVLYRTTVEDYADSNNIPYSPYLTGYTNVSASENVPRNTTCFKNSLTPPRFYIYYPDKFASVEDLTAWLQSNNTAVYYALATATDTTITDQTLIAQLEAVRTAALSTGSNTISNTATGTNLAGDLEIGYYGYNSRNRYDKFIWLDINNEYEQIGN